MFPAEDIGGGTHLFSAYACLVPRSLHVHMTWDMRHWVLLEDHVLLQRCCPKRVYEATLIFSVSFANLIKGLWVLKLCFCLVELCVQFQAPLCGLGCCISSPRSLSVDWDAVCPVPGPSLWTGILCIQSQAPLWTRMLCDVGRPSLP